MYILRVVVATFLLIAAFFVGLASYVFFTLWLIIIRQGYYETGSLYVWILIVPGLLPYCVPVYLLIKAWKLTNYPMISKAETKQAVKILYGL